MRSVQLGLRVERRSCLSLVDQAGDGVAFVGLADDLRLGKGRVGGVKSGADLSAGGGLWTEEVFGVAFFELHEI